MSIWGSANFPFAIRYQIGWTSHPRFAEAVFRHACGLIPFASSTQAVSWLRENTSSFAPILPVDSPLVLDLSVGSPLLHGDARENVEPKLTRRIQ